VYVILCNVHIHVCRLMMNGKSNIERSERDKGKNDVTNGATLEKMTNVSLSLFI